MFNLKSTDARIQKGGAIASFLIPAAFIASSLIYLTGNLGDPMGLFVYSIADFLYGPIWAVSLITAVFALRERIGERAPRRMLVALLAAFLAAGMMVLGACIRSANRQYHIIHPELHLESSIDVLLVWTTLYGRCYWCGVALFRVGTGTDRISRLDKRKPTTRFVRFISGRRGRRPICLSVPRFRRSRCLAHGSMGIVAGILFYGEIIRVQRRYP